VAHRGRPGEELCHHQHLKDALMDYTCERKGVTVGNGSMSDVDEFSRSEDE
jgi:hypothetical protein